jgi:cell division septum initiation protein DivIVA
MSDPLPPAKIAGTRDFEEILLELREMIDTARTMPMSSSVLVHRDEALELLGEVLERLPAELRQARWLLKEREEYLTQARRDADDLMDAARVQAERMVERTELTREAKRAAQQIVTEAEADARRLRHEAEDYVEARLLAFEGALERTLETIQKGRARFQVPLEPLTEDDEESDPDADFFDQDEG